MSDEIVVQKKNELVLEGDPEQQLNYAKKAADALMKVVKPAKINGKDYLQFGGWQTLGRFFGATVGIEWTKTIEVNGKVTGYEARAIVYQRGDIISSAEAICSRSERNWANRDEYALKSMAQTRASAKALRNAFGWVAELAGLESTPAEEMEGVISKPAPSIPDEIRQQVMATTSMDGLRTLWNQHKGLGKEFSRLVTEKKSELEAQSTEKVIEA